MKETGGLRHGSGRFVIGAVMEGLFIVHLVGVVGLFTGLAFFIAVALRAHRTLDEISKTLKTLQKEMEELTPRLASVLEETGRTGSEIGRLAGAVASIVEGAGRLEGRIGSAAGYVPLVMTLVKGVATAVSRRRRK